MLRARGCILFSNLPPRDFFLSGVHSRAPVKINNYPRPRSPRAPPVPHEPSMKGMASAAEGGGDPLLIPQYGSTAEALGDEDQPYALSLLRSSCDSCWKKKVQIQACLSSDSSAQASLGALVPGFPTRGKKGHTYIPIPGAWCKNQFSLDNGAC